MILQSESGPEAKAPKLLLMCPPATGDMSRVPDIAEKFAAAHERSRRFPQYYEALAAALGCAYLNSQEVVTSSAADGLHLDAPEHTKLGVAVALMLKDEQFWTA